MALEPGRFLNPRLLLLPFLAAFLLVFNLAIAGKESLTGSGAVIILRLAPVDPRSLMQGDYMALNFSEASAMYSAAADSSEGGSYDSPPAGEFLAVMAEGDNGVYRFVRLHGPDAPGPGERLLRFRVRNRQVVIGGGSFFFEEGSGPAYDRARYAKLRVAKDGTAIITELLRDDFTTITAEREQP